MSGRNGRVAYRLASPRTLPAAEAPEYPSFAACEFNDFPDPMSTAAADVTGRASLLALESSAIDVPSRQPPPGL